MSAAKKLPCGHFFHVHCLRSWLERQQTCPTCRAPVSAPETAPANAAEAPAAHQHGHQQDQRPVEGWLGPYIIASGIVYRTKVSITSLVVNLACVAVSVKCLLLSAIYINH